MRLVNVWSRKVFWFGLRICKGAIALMRKSSLMAMLLVFSLVPLLGPPTPVSKAQTAPRRGSGVRKMTEALLARSRQSRPNGGEKTRVIFNLADSASADQACLKLQRSGAEISKQLDAVNVVVANVPVSMLESLAANDEVSWVSADQEVRSLATDEGSSNQCNEFDNPVTSK